MPQVDAEPATNVAAAGSGAAPDVAALREGDASAVAAAYDAHHVAVRRLARRLLGDDVSAEDLVHEVFVRLPETIRSYRGDAALRTFLLSVAANRSRHFVRAAARRRAATSRLAAEPTGRSEAPDESLERRRLAVALATALDDLPHGLRVAFVLSDIEERPSPEVAAILDVPEGTVRSRLHAARKKLRRSLERGGWR